MKRKQLFYHSFVLLPSWHVVQFVINCCKFDVLESLTSLSTIRLKPKNDDCTINGGNNDNSNNNDDINNNDNNNNDNNNNNNVNSDVDDDNDDDCIDITQRLS